MFGELRSQPSRLAPDAAMDPAVGQLVASGLASASTMLAASLLRSAFRYPSSLVTLRFVCLCYHSATDGCWMIGSVSAPKPLGGVDSAFGHEGVSMVSWSSWEQQPKVLKDATIPPTVEKVPLV